MINRQQIMSDVDTIDHITILPRWNKPFDRAKAIAALKRCKTFYGDVFDFSLPDFARLEAASDQELLDELVAVRETLLRHIF